MKTLTFMGTAFQADKIFKTSTDIYGQDANGNELFRFSNITDFSGYALATGQTFDTPAPSTAETLASLTYTLMDKGLI